MKIYPIIFTYLLDYFVKKPSYLDSFCYYFYFVYFIYCYFIVLFRQSFCYFSDIWDDNTTTGGMNHTIIIFLHFILHNITLLKGRICMCLCVCSQLCPTLCDPMDCSPPGQAPPSMEFSSKNIGVGCHFLFQRMFLHQGSNPSPLHWQSDSLPLSHLGSPINLMTFTEATTNDSRSHINSFKYL